MLSSVKKDSTEDNSQSAVQANLLVDRLHPVQEEWRRLANNCDAPGVGSASRAAPGDGAGSGCAEDVAQVDRWSFNASRSEEAGAGGGAAGAQLGAGRAAAAGMERLMRRRDSPALPQRYTPTTGIVKQLSRTLDTTITEHEQPPPPAAAAAAADHHIPDAAAAAAAATSPVTLLDNRS